MENEMKRKHCFFFPDFMVSLKVPVAVLMVLFGMIPMVLCTQVLIGTLRQIQTDSRMIEVQNQCQILSSKMTRTDICGGIPEMERWTARFRLWQMFITVELSW